MMILHKNWEENLLKMNKPHNWAENRYGYTNNGYTARRLAGTVKIRIKAIHAMIKAGTAIVKTN
jgi:hypothetical protein